MLDLARPFDDFDPGPLASTRIGADSPPSKLVTVFAVGAPAVVLGLSAGLPGVVVGAALGGGFLYGVRSLVGVP